VEVPTGGYGYARRYEAEPGMPVHT
jgi:hypothetical protein